MKSRDIKGRLIWCFRAAPMSGPVHELPSFLRNINPYSIGLRLHYGLPTNIDTLGLICTDNSMDPS